MSFVEELRAKYSVEYIKASSHHFTQELCNGSLDDKILYIYLMQDQKFFITSLRFIARTMSLCNQDAPTVTLGKQLGFLSHDENTYFKETLKELQESGNTFSPEIAASKEKFPKINEFLTLLDDLSTKSDSYVVNIATLYVVESVYLKWADEQGGSEERVKRLAFKHKGWIDLHRGVDFTAWVNFLGSEVDRVVKEDPKNQKIVCDVVKRTVSLEWYFFEECYYYKE